METEITGPKFCPVINLTKWIENGFASWPAAKHRFILYRRQVWTFFQRCKETSQRNNHSGSLKTAGRPHVPTKTHTIPFFILLNELQICCHSLKETGPSGSPGRSRPQLHLQGTGSGSHRQVQLSPQPIDQRPRSSRRPPANQRAPPWRRAQARHSEKPRRHLGRGQNRGASLYKTSFSEHTSLRVHL